MYVFFPLFLSVVSASVDISQNTEEDLSYSGLTELDIGADEVFIVSSVPSPGRLPFSPHTVRLTFMPINQNILQIYKLAALLFT